MDTTTPHGKLLSSPFGVLAQYERALTCERVMAGLVAAKRRGRKGGRPPMIDAETLERITKCWSRQGLRMPDLQGAALDPVRNAIADQKDRTGQGLTACEIPRSRDIIIVTIPFYETWYAFGDSRARFES
jgi:DNA invertase Pin-like site-specific DNA recombinase